MTHWVLKLIRYRKLFKFKPIDITKKVSNNNDRSFEASVRSRTLEFEFLIYNCANYWKPLSNKKKKKLKAIKIENNKTQLYSARTGGSGQNELLEYKSLSLSLSLLGWVGLDPRPEINPSI